MDCITDKSLLIELRNAVNDSARIYRTVFITFLLLHFYLLAIAIPVDHVALFKDEILKTPILNIGIKTSVFFKLAPAIILLVYLELLVQAYVLVKKTDAYKNAMAGTHGYNEMLGTLLSIPLLQIVSGQYHGWKFRLVLHFIVSAMLFLLPILTLAFIMWKFLPYQNAGISLIHKIAIIIGIVMAISFYWALFAKKKTTWSFIIGAIVVFLVLFTSPLFMHPAKEPDFESAFWKLIPTKETMEKKYKRWHTLNVTNERLYRETEHTPLDVCDEKYSTFGLKLGGRSYIQADLSSSIFCHAKLEGAQLQGAQLQGAVLRRAQLQRAQLQGADLFGAKLQGADLGGTKLQGADLEGAELQRAVLRRAHLQDAVLTDAQLQGADLSSTELQGADLFGAKLQGAVLSYAWLQDADLGGAQLQGADLGRARLQDADLGGAQLQGADLGGTELQEAYLEDAELQGAFSSRQLVKNLRELAFEERIRARVDQASDLSDVVFSGGMEKRDIERIVKRLEKVGWGEKKITRLKKLLEPHVAEDKSNQLPEDAGAIIGKYSQAEADKWIQEYQQALEEDSGE